MPVATVSTTAIRVSGNSSKTRQPNIYTHLRHEMVIQWDIKTTEYDMTSYIDDIPIHNNTKSTLNISYSYNVISSNDLNRLKEIICVEVISEINRWCNINLIEFSSDDSNLNLKFETNFINNKDALKTNLFRRFSQNSIDINDINIT